MIPEFCVGTRRLPHGFEFHLAPVDSPAQALCGETVEPTQIPPLFYGVDSAIEGRWCTRCEARARLARIAPEPASAGDAPCL